MDTPAENQDIPPSASDSARRNEVMQWLLAQLVACDDPAAIVRLTTQACTRIDPSLHVEINLASHAQVVGPATDGRSGLYRHRLSLPIQFGAHVFGSFDLAGAAAFDPAETACMQAIAHLLAIALMNAQPGPADPHGALQHRPNLEDFQYLFEHNPHPMWAYDLETLRFLVVNDAAVHKYGYTRDEFLRMTIADIRPTEDVPRLLSHLTFLRNDLRQSGVWRHRLQDGSMIEVEIASHMIEVDGRKAALVVAQDVTAAGGPRRNCLS